MVLVVVTLSGLSGTMASVLRSAGSAAELEPASEPDAAVSTGFDVELVAVGDELTLLAGRLAALRRGGGERAP